MTAGTGERIAKYLASAGVASRRDVERMIAEGRVSVDGERLTTPAFKVSGVEKILVDGQPVRPPDAARLWRYHKPAGLMTTNKDPEGRPTVFESLPKGMPRVVTIGRLDINTEGLLLLTNDGGLARNLELPATGVERKYRARAYGRIDQSELDRLRDGVIVDGVEYRAIVARLARVTGSNCWIDVSVAEGKNREVRRALESLGLKVNRLIRVAYGPFQLDDLGPGAIEEVDPAQLMALAGAHIAAERRPRMSATRAVQRPKPHHAPKLARERRRDPGGLDSYVDGSRSAERFRKTAPAKRPPAGSGGKGRRTPK